MPQSGARRDVDIANFSGYVGNVNIFTPERHEEIGALLSHAKARWASLLDCGVSRDQITPSTEDDNR